jgi:hypothetical protein
VLSFQFGKYFDEIQVVKRRGSKLNIFSRKILLSIEVFTKIFAFLLDLAGGGCAS